LYVFHNQVNTLYQFWIHTRLIGKLPAPIEWIFNTPSHHRVHQGCNPQFFFFFFFFFF
jgi:sterol desaturase/sphingolipid hydroxylase (fatty acid hydroxylase superfamily)